jgi:hypothetical protein
VLQLANPNPGDLLPTGDIIVSGVAFDPAATSGPGIERVDLFLGQRDAGGTFLGSAVPATNASGQTRAFQIDADIPSSIAGGRDFVAYAYSSVNGQQTSLSLPVNVGVSPTAVPSGSPGNPAPTPVPAIATLLSSCQGIPASTVAAATSSTTSATSAQLPVSHAGPVLSLANPSAGDVLLNGDVIIEGTAFDPAATDGAGVDRVELFLDSRDAGGLSLGSGSPGANGASSARAFHIKVTVPTNANGGHTFYAYAHSAVTGQETVVSVPLYVGTPPTPTPRPASS